MGKRKSVSRRKLAKSLRNSPTRLLLESCTVAAGLYRGDRDGAQLDPWQLSILATAQSEAGVCLADLATATGIAPGPLQDTVADLIDRRLLDLVPPPAATSELRVRSTDYGLQEARTAQDAVTRADAGLLAMVPSGKRRKFLGALKAVVRKARAEAEAEAAKSASKEHDKTADTRATKLKSRARKRAPTDAATAAGATAAP